MPYDKDLRQLIKATKKVAKPIPVTVDERLQKLRDDPTEVTTSQPADEPKQPD
jgi:hypothetical protein